MVLYATGFILTFNLGREKPGGDAICLVSVDEAVGPEVMNEVKALHSVVRVNELRF